MAAPPPQSDTDTAAITFGIAAMDEVLEKSEIDFPVATPDLIGTVGDRAIPYDPRGNTVELRVAIEETGQDQFESRRDLLNALHPVFEEKRRGGGIGEWLQSLFSF